MYLEKCLNAFKYAEYVKQIILVQFKLYNSIYYILLDILNMLKNICIYIYIYNEPERLELYIYIYIYIYI